MDFGTIIWVVLIGGLLYFMMKGGGCCGGNSKKEGHDHGDGGKTNDDGTGADPEHKKGCH